MKEKMGRQQVPERTAMVNMVHVLLAYLVATRHSGALSPCDVACATEKVNFEFYII